MENIWTLLGNFSKEMKTMSQMAIWEIKNDCIRDEEFLCGAHH